MEHECKAADRDRDLDYTAYNHGWTQVIESGAELAGTPLPAVSPGGQIDTVVSGSFYKIANSARRDRDAFFDATGVRLYRMPMTPGLVRGALSA